MNMIGVARIPAAKHCARPDVPAGGCSARASLKGLIINKELFRGGSRSLEQFVCMGRTEHPAKILVVEDNPEVRELLEGGIPEFVAGEISLINDRFLTMTADKIAEHILEGRFDCIVLDNELLQIRGRDIAGILRQRNFMGWIIANSGEGNDDLLQAGADLAVTFKTCSLAAIFQP